MTEVDELGPGEIGFITAAIKEVADTRVGDTITDDRKPGRRACCRASSRRSPVVFCGLFPVDAADFEDLRAAMGKLRLNDASFSFEMETSRRARLRLPLRLPRAAASGDHPGAARARVRSQPDRDRAVGDLQDAPDRRHGDRDAQSGRHARRGEDRRDRGAVDRGHHPDARRISRPRAEAVPGPPRRRRRSSPMSARARW